MKTLAAPHNLKGMGKRTYMKQPSEGNQRTLGSFEGLSRPGKRSTPHMNKIMIQI